MDGALVGRFFFIFPQEAESPPNEPQRPNGGSHLLPLGDSEVVEGPSGGALGKSFLLPREHPALGKIPLRVRLPESPVGEGPGRPVLGVTGGCLGRRWLGGPGGGRGPPACTISGFGRLLFMLLAVRVVGSPEK